MAKNSCLFPALYFNGVEGCVGQVYFLVGQALKTSEIPTIFILVLENGDLKGRGVVVCGFKDWPSILIQILLTEKSRMCCFHKTWLFYVFRLDKEEW